MRTTPEPSLSVGFCSLSFVSVLLFQLSACSVQLRCRTKALKLPDEVGISRVEYNAPVRQPGSEARRGLPLLELVAL
ncbi:hypothetical protein MRX96_027617 [Rhipicephalus microplus]